MYREFFGLRERPFDLTANPRFLVATEGHREALSNLVYGIRSRKGVVLLVGEAGSGKTTVVRAALAAQPRHVHSIHLHNPALTRSEFIELMSSCFGLSGEAARSKAAFLLEMEALLRKRHAQGETTVLVVDEAQSLPHDLLEEVRLLANFETDDAKLLTVVLSGQPEIAAHLNDGSLRQLKQRIALRCELKPLSLNETASYIAGRISAGGGVGAHVFTRQAVTLIHEHSGGIPRLISVICDNALLTAFALGQRPITTQVVIEVCRDFDLRMAAAEPVAVTEQVASIVASPSRPEPSRLLAVAKDHYERRGLSKAPADTTHQRGSDSSDADQSLSDTYPRRRLFRFFGA